MRPDKHRRRLAVFLPRQQMLPPPAERRRFDFLAWGLLLTGLIVAGSVLGQETPGRDTAPLASVYPPPASGNLLGPPGAWLADALFDTLGSAVYLLLASWFILVVLLLLRHSLLTWTLRLAGWLLLVPCAAVLAETWAAGREGWRPSGGAVGVWLSAWLAEHFEPLGQALLLGSAVLLGLFLTADFVLLRVLRLGWRLGRALWRMERATDDSAPTEGRKSPEMDSGDLRPPLKESSSGDLRPPLREDASSAQGADTPPSAARQVPIVRPAPVQGEEAFDDYELPPLSLLDDPEPFPYEEHDKHLRAQAVLLEKTFQDFGLNVRVVGINTGPVITQYEVALETGLRVHKVTSLADDLALNLKVPSVRMVAPIPGKNAVGIEIPNEHRAIVRLKEVILTAGKPAARLKLPLFLGKDTEGKPLVYDLAEMPHLLIAGRTGTGKSVCLNTIVLSILMTRRPDEVKMVMIDPKMNELTEYGRIPHLMHPVVKDVKKAEAILSWAVDKMEERYDLLSRARVRNIAGYNQLGIDEIHRRLQPDEEERARIPERMPYIVIFVDEMGDLMMQMKREVEGHIIRLAQKSRAAGIHLVVATQKPTVDVITGLIKSNLPARICFQVSSRSDSRVVLDEIGADKLLGKGDMLFLQPGTSTLIRAQGAYAGDHEIERVVEHLGCEPCYAEELLQLRTTTPVGEGGNFVDRLRARDEVYPQAIEVVIREGRGSVSLLQRALGIGYGRAARLIDFMAEDGIVGAYKGSSAREVLYTPDQWEQVKTSGQFLPRAG
jgi:S-DNA-T family DNA segregation ATPase FtsK/SpoIIIE